MAAQNIMLMAHALGLATCFFNFPISSPSSEYKIAEILNIPYPEYVLIGFISVAWPLFPRTLGPTRHDANHKAWANKLGNTWENFKEV